MEVTYESLKVMVIDDSKTIRRTAETLLKKAGCTVITATDGFDALAKIADTRPDIIFVDIMMPRLDGYQTCALITANSRQPRSLCSPVKTGSSIRPKGVLSVQTSTSPNLLVKVNCWARLKPMSSTSKLLECWAFAQSVLTLYLPG